MKRYLAVFLLPFLGALTPAQEYPQLVTSTESSAPIRVDRGEASQEDHQQPPLDVLHPERQIKRRPRIALVLEGGGALGLAHLGVLSWFEQHHIPIDYIAGTSMGGLVGGLYATGNDPDQIHSFLRTVNWNAALNNNLPYSDLAFRRKEDARIYPPNLEFGFRGRSGVFASGFNSGHDVGLILDRVAYPYGDLRSFDDLPTPFRCVATDLVSGQPVVFDHGSLADALRATMSLPAIFSPVRRDGKILVDGGLLANLPVDVARRMGADVVIAVNLQTKPLEADASLSAFAVLQRSISVVIAVNELESMRRADLIIQVRTQDYTALTIMPLKNS